MDLDWLHTLRIKNEKTLISTLSSLKAKVHTPELQTTSTVYRVDVTLESLLTHLLYHMNGGLSSPQPTCCWGTLTSTAF